MSISASLGAAGQRPGVCTSSTRPASPFEGQIIYETNTDRTLVWNNSAWVFLSTSTAYPVGLELIKTQSVGPLAPNVDVTDVFSASYDNYKIIYSGGVGSTSSNLTLQLGTAGTGSAYYGFLNAATYAGVAADLFVNNAASFTYAGNAATTHVCFAVNLYEPFASAWTKLHSEVWATSTTAGVFTGVHQATTSYTGFRIAPSTGTITGGVVYVYGYKE